VKTVRTTDAAGDRRDHRGAETIEAPTEPPFEEPLEESPEVSFRRFVAARWAALQRYAYLLTGDQQTAEDVVQIALERCWRRWRQIRSESPEAYVRAAVANTAASRRRRRRLPESPLDDVVHPIVATGDHTENHALRSGLWPALSELPPRRRAVVVLRVWEDLSIAETAEILGISTGAVKSQLSKAMTQLRRHPQVREAAGLPTDGPDRTPRPEVPR
jgi:RNA polymerase sigma-70 factor (sigma-E family)